MMKKKSNEMSKEDEIKIQTEFVMLSKEVMKNVDLHMGMLQIKMEKFLKKNKMKYDIETFMDASFEWKLMK